MYLASASLLIPATGGIASHDLSRLRGCTVQNLFIEVNNQKENGKT